MPNEQNRDAGDLTLLLRGLKAGSKETLERVMEAVYPELRRIARVKLSRERAGHTLQPTALVHEAYLKLVEQDNVSWANRSHFYAVAATAMRRILVDHARRRGADKRGGGAIHVTLSAAGENLPSGPTSDILAVDEALRKLEQLNPLKAKVVELRYFAGLEETEVAEVLGVSRSTVQRDWRFAKAWLLRELHR